MKKCVSAFVFLTIIFLQAALAIVPSIPIAAAAGNVTINDFTSSITKGTIPLETRFSGNVSGEVTRWRWSFYNPQTNSWSYSISNLTTGHTFGSAGAYGVFNVTLDVWGPGGSDSLKKIDYVVANLNTTSLPVANFAASSTSGPAPLTVTFTDNSIDANSILWYFGMTGTSTEKNPAYTFNSPGIYRVVLEVSNSNGWDATAQDIIVGGQGDGTGSSSEGDNGASNGDGGSSGDSSSNGDGSSSGDGSGSDSSSGDGSGSSSASSSGSSSGGSGGGSVGGSPEPQSNVEAKEVSQAFIGNGNFVNFAFPQNATPVMNISFGSKTTVGKTAAIVEVLKNQSTLVSGSPSDEIYKFINIWVGNGGVITPDKIENAVVNFKVEKSRIQDNNMDRSSISLNRYNDTKWDTLPTNLTGEDDKYLYFSAQTAAFSYFAITGKAAVNGTLEETNSRPAAQSVEQDNASNVTIINQPQTTNNLGISKTTPVLVMSIVIICLFAAFLFKRK